ncbi:hypothetical protein [Pseudoalteromonas sp. T1lg75]|uniref:hypothetical protein n=1 Tax=Pseudoalteromonas sp. T1lg75 TaxID=2077102 RepID=UPI000CF74C8B|nr:hypothetical protein [Pseudoalteromonas sp. T1lg75]
MKKSDLRCYSCPELFVRFKLALRAAQSEQQDIAFVLKGDDIQGSSDIKRYLTKQKLAFAVTTTAEQLIITVEKETRV